MNPDKTTRQKPVRKWRRICLVALIVLVLLAGLAPQLMVKSGTVHWLINPFLADSGIQIRASGGSLGWTSPVQLNGLEITQQDPRWSAHVDHVIADRSWLNLWRSRPELGHFVVTRPQIRVIMESLKPADLSDETEEEREDTPVLQWSAAVREAQLTVESPALSQPVIDLNDLDLRLGVIPREGQQVLRVEPMVVLDHYEITPELCRDGLQLVVPILASAMHVEGAISLELQKFEVPIGPGATDQDLSNDIAGVVELHHVSAAIKNPLMRQITGLVGELTGSDVPTTIRIAKDTAVGFHVRHDRVFHDGLTFMLPEFSDNVVLHSTGSVGFDESLDLLLDIPIPFLPLLERMSPETTLDRSLQLHVTGTLKEPHFALPAGWGPLVDLAEAALDSNQKKDRPLVRSILGVVGEALRPAPTDEEKPALGGLLDRLRQVRQRGRPLRRDPEEREPDRP